MKISTTQYFRQTTDQLNNIQSDLSKTQEQMSTMKKINTPSDAPDQAANITRLQSALTRQKSYQDTIKTVNTRLSAQETALTSASDVMAKIKELAIQAANDTTSAQDRQTIATQISTLRDQLVSLANSKDAEGNYLFAGSKSNQPAFAADATGQVVYQGDQARMKVNIGDTRQINLNMPGSDAFVRVTRTDNKGNPYGVDFFKSIDDLTASISQSDHTNIQRGISEISHLSDGLSQGLGQIGADQTIADMQGSVLDATVLRLKTSKSDIEDTDYTEAATLLSKQTLALQAAQNSFAKISQLSLFQFLR